MAPMEAAAAVGNTAVGWVLQSSPLEIIIALVLGLLVLALTWVQLRRDTFDLRELLVDEENKLSINRLGQLVALIISSWGFIYLIVHDKFNETYLLVFMATWSGADAIKLYLKYRFDKFDSSSIQQPEPIEQKESK